MLEHLFGSRTRVKLLRVFLGNPGSSYFVRELARKVGAQIHAVRRELENLERLRIIRGAAQPEASAAELRAQLRKYYTLEESFFLVNELRALVLKSQFLLEEDFTRRVRQLGEIRYFVLLGSFVGATDASVDVFIVGRLNRNRLAELMADFERELGNPLNYAVLTDREFEYRWKVGDRFLYGILDGKKVVVIDELTPAGRETPTAA
ncbi:hypothetical protein HYV74_04630 [Candidatus Uhrbacteria bacterium]|nr:hypothetical protein [Candidatus Uhrbacteria bacterium]